MVLACGCGPVLSGCLVTDAIELPPEPGTPPVITSPTNYPVGSIIELDGRTARELRIQLRVRDEDKTETLKVRWRITSDADPAQRPVEYDCPEVVRNEIPPNGELIRDDWWLTIPSVRFLPGTCSQLDVVVGSNFRPCRPQGNNNDFAYTTTDDDDAHVGWATFLVWEVSAAALTDPQRSQQLAVSCPTKAYTPTGSTLVEEPVN